MYKLATLVLLSFICNVQPLNTTNFNLEDYPGENCYRNCIKGQTKICYFNFVMEHYQAMGVACGNCASGVIEDCFHPQCITVDGIERGVTSINRKVPSPAIHVCHGDRIVIDVVNGMSGTSTTLHWHGLHMRGTQMYDGVPHVTQCPIGFGQTFRYQFIASEAGTMWYHSHAGHHKINGHFGSMVIRRGDNEPHRQIYDYDIKEHTMIVTDWVHSMAEMFVPGLPSRYPGLTAENLLINGKGVFVQNDGTSTKSPIEVFKVQQDKKYRFRFVNGASYGCPAQLQIQDHTIDIIATDSQDVEAVTVDTLVSNGGERYDFVLNANQTLDHYCVKVKLLGSCNKNQIEQYAILKYSNFENHEVSPTEYQDAGALVEKCRQTFFTEDSYMNHPNTTCYDSSHNSHCSADLSALEVDNSLLNAEVDQSYVISYNNYLVSKTDMFDSNRYEHFLNPSRTVMLQSGLNNISFVWPTISLMTQANEIREDMFCDNIWNKPKRCQDQTLCHCTHRHKIQLGSVVELVLIDGGTVINDISHPFHMHGYGLLVTEMGQVREMKRETIPRRKNPPIKDTISIPSAGYVILRFRADNPGFWLLHCHIDHHFASGMTMLIQVGEPRHFPPAPKGFPRCNNFVPDVRF